MVRACAPGRDEAGNRDFIYPAAAVLFAAMNKLSILGLKLLGLAVVGVCWRTAVGHPSAFLWEAVLVWGFVALVPLLAIAGRSLLDTRPTVERASLLTIPIHYAEMVLLGWALIVAFRLTGAHPFVRISFPRGVSFRVLQVLGVVSTFTVLNLAIRGLGLPFAAVLSKKLATNWLYARCRNPMLLSCLLFFTVGAVWLQSLHALLWTLLWLAPAWILYVRIYEERELEIRFGHPYVAYKARTPFFF